MNVSILTLFGFNKSKPAPQDKPQPLLSEEKPKVEVVNPHLDKYTAEKVMSHIKYTDKEGVLHTEPKWSPEDIDNETCYLEFPNGTTLYDKWVAYNFFYADTCKALGVRDALNAAYYFYFQDEDAPNDKLYKYLKAMGTI